ncbi:MAG: response regulator transcription factor [Proteobacteria bacterium]|nr:response regulator transcription factor [Pseudomonadota bacterium]MBU1057301.1 response regulator transcription factor [Pseudomonadota bacterium]
MVSISETAKTENSILIIDDDVDLCDLLTSYLQQEGYRIETAFNSQDGLIKAQSNGFSFIVLDVMLPGMSGFDVLRKIRLTSQVPILMLTARGGEVDRIVGLEMGADDYMPKPFNPRELVARIRAIKRRGREEGWNEWSGEKTDKLITGDIVLDLGTRTVKREGILVVLTAAEFSLLEKLIINVGHVVKREDLARGVFGRNLAMFDRSIDVHISSLRKKLGRQVDGVERIKTVRSVGYLYVGV